MGKNRKKRKRKKHHSSHTANSTAKQELATPTSPPLTELPAKNPDKLTHDQAQIFLLYNDNRCHEKITYIIDRNLVNDYKKLHTNILKAGTPFILRDWELPCISGERKALEHIFQWTNFSNFDIPYEYSSEFNAMEFILNSENIDGIFCGIEHGLVERDPSYWAEKILTVIVFQGKISSILHLRKLYYLHNYECDFNIYIDKYAHDDAVIKALTDPVLLDTDQINSALDRLKNTALLLASGAMRYEYHWNHLMPPTNSIRNSNKISEHLKMGANPNVVNIAGQSPLILAARYGDAQIVRELLQAGAKINVKNKRGDTPLTYAIKCDLIYEETYIKIKGLVSVIKDLLDAYAPGSLNNSEGEHALMLAFKNYRQFFSWNPNYNLPLEEKNIFYQITDLLIEATKGIHLKDKNKRKLQILAYQAVEFGDKSVIEQLIKMGLEICAPNCLDKATQINSEQNEQREPTTCLTPATVKTDNQDTRQNRFYTANTFWQEKFRKTTPADNNQTVNKGNNTPTDEKFKSTFNATLSLWKERDKLESQVKTNSRYKM